MPSAGAFEIAQACLLLPEDRSYPPLSCSGLQVLFEVLTKKILLELGVFLSDSFGKSFAWA